MMKMTTVASVALIALLALSGCSKVEKCTKGEPGCLEAATKADGTCAAGLVAKGNQCVKPSGGSGGGNGSCHCASDEVCAADGSCIAYCAPVANPPQVNPTPTSCEPVVTGSDSNPPALTFAQLCRASCEQNCLRAEVFCPGHTCKVSECDNAAQLARCALDCPMKDTACMQARCDELQGASCDMFKCPAGSTRSCGSDVHCSDSCAGNNNDGFCDDGDPASATYSFCPYGTDCSDCGPRRGPRPARGAFGDVCPGGQDVACDGYNDDFLKTGAWCLRVVPKDDSAPFRCVPDCTTANGAGNCPADYECQAVLTSEGAPYTDATRNKTPGYACVPTVCQ
jgi:hypothetical protein